MSAEPDPSAASAHIGAAIGVLGGAAIVLSPAPLFAVGIVAAGLLGLAYLSYRTERAQLQRGETA